MEEEDGRISIDSNDDNRNLLLIEHDNEKRNRTTRLFHVTRFCRLKSIAKKVRRNILRSEIKNGVVQVWFQNARAKEKKNPHFFKSDLPDEYQPTNEQCKLCQCKYTLQNPQRDHLFTTKHIENIRCILSKQISSNVATIKDDQNYKQNSINVKLDLDNLPTSVSDKSTYVLFKFDASHVT
ncbi:unnamed protein product [Adineta ricciae]|uniref:Homeobox domain-containing protein n=1 Tax=Adineta ricciae TaxID=249248 RepID=A0A815NBJ6_ADIRI|nr:unnamed protein product [Adineta ricciae]CAF1436013.1 unnamed protein product [Adineta ricciae]